MGRRITRKQLKKKDEFVTIADQVMRWISEYWKHIVVAVAACALVAALWWAAASWSSSRSDGASQLLAKAIKTLEGEISPETGQPGGGDEEAAEQQLLEVVDRYSSSDQADVARLYLARFHLGRGEDEEARDLLVRLADRHGDDAIGRTATLDLIHLQVATGQGAEVAQQLRAMASGQNRSLPPDVAMYELGELYIHEQDLAQAKEFLQKLIDEFPDSAYSGPARQKLTELG